LQNGFRGGVVGYDVKDILAASIVSANADVRRFTISHYNCIDAMRVARANLMAAAPIIRVFHSPGKAWPRLNQPSDADEDFLNS
jgi:hypothetical protein